MTASVTTEIPGRRRRCRADPYEVDGERAAELTRALVGEDGRALDTGGLGDEQALTGTGAAGHDDPTPYQ
jgi:hypothetical protein